MAKTTAEEVLLCLFWLALLAVPVVGTIDGALYKKYKNKYDKIKPISCLTATEDSLVYSIGDSVLNARVARYDELVRDYKYAFDEIDIKSKAVFIYKRNFDKYFVYPKYAEQIGAKNLKQYSTHIDDYIRDSLTPAYVNVYKNKVVPNIRNNTWSK